MHAQTHVKPVLTRDPSPWPVGQLLRGDHGSGEKEQGAGGRPTAAPEPWQGPLNRLLPLPPALPAAFLCGCRENTKDSTQMSLQWFTSDWKVSDLSVQ